MRKGKYREGYAAKFLGRVPPRTSRKTCLWLHAVSVGEVNLLAPLLKMIEQQRPDWECVISTTTATGMATAKKKYPQHTVFYCPLDFSWAVKAAMRRVRPDVLVLAELELWPNLIRAARRSGAPRGGDQRPAGREEFSRLSAHPSLVASLLRQIDLLAVQDETYAERFRALGARPETVHVTGSMKYDGAQTDRNNPATRRLAALAGFADDDIVLLAGSTQEPEEAMALETFRQLSPQWPRLRLVLVPRHPDRFEAVAKLLDSSGIPWQRRTALAVNAEAEASALQLLPLPLPSPLPSRPAGRRGRRIGGLVGNGADRVCRREHGQPRRTEHDRTGRLRRRRLLRTEHLELPRRRLGDARNTRPRWWSTTASSSRGSSAVAWSSPTTPPRSAGVPRRSSSRNSARPERTLALLIERNEFRSTTL